MFATATKAKPTTPQELHETIRLMIGYADELIQFGIKPGEINDVRTFYEKSIMPVTAGNTDFALFLGAFREKIRLTDLNLPEMNTIEEWSVQVTYFGELNRRLMGDFGFSPNTLNATVKKRVEQRIILGRLNCSDATVTIPKRIVVMRAALDKFANIPFQVGS